MSFIHYSTFFLNCFLNITGIKVINAKTISRIIELQENASWELVIVLSVLPPCIAKNDGGATPRKENHVNLLLSILSSSSYLNRPILVAIKRFFLTHLSENSEEACQKKDTSIPKNVPTAKGNKGTPITGATRFINQLGSKGVILKNNI